MTEPAEQESSASLDGSLTRVVQALPWLAPVAASLVRLAGSPVTSTWASLRHDPGALLLLRCPCPPPPLPFHEALLHQPLPLATALRLLARPAAGLIDWSLPVAAAVLDACGTLGRAARALAVRAGACDPEQAWCAGLLSPLGWLGVCAAAPAAAAVCLADPDQRRHPAGAQLRHWGADQASLARRLASAWGLPAWLAGVVGQLDLPPRYAHRLGAQPVLFSVVRLAASLAREHAGCQVLSGETSPAEDEAIAGIRISGLRVEDLLAGEPAPPPLDRADPYRQPLLRELLATAIDNRRLRQAPVVARLEQEVDELHAALREQVGGERERLGSAKLSALAELAAGAGHEINNPLAVISGQAQYLLGHEADFFAAGAEEPTRKALNTIIGQTKRIHGILRDLMMFARPSPPHPAWVDLPTLMGEAAASLTDLAGQKRVRVEVSARPERLAVFADGDQVRTALGCLLRNAVEAAPAEGWARLVLGESGSALHVEVFVEDSGPGPTAEQRPHLFDPFYSGRSAGRGRGMGLPVAWRLIRQQGGDIRLESARPDAPTRFALTLPRAAAGSGEQKAA